MSPSVVLITATSFALTFLFSCLVSGLSPGFGGCCCWLGSAARAATSPSARLTVQIDVNIFIGPQNLTWLDAKVTLGICFKSTSADPKSDTESPRKHDRR